MEIPSLFDEYKTSGEMSPPEPPPVLEDSVVPESLGSQATDSQAETAPPWYLDPNLPSTPVEIHILDDSTYVPGSLSFL